MELAPIHSLHENQHHINVGYATKLILPVTMFLQVWDSIIISKFEGVEVSVRWNSEVIVKIMKSRVQRLVR